MPILNAILPWGILAAGIGVLGIFMVIRHRVSPIWFLFPAALCGLAVLFLVFPEKDEIFVTYAIVAGIFFLWQIIRKQGPVL